MLQSIAVTHRVVGLASYAGAIACTLRLAQFNGCLFLVFVLLWELTWLLIV